MTLSSADTPLRADDRGRTPRRGYIFLVTALAVFLLGIVVLRTPVRGYVVSAVLAWEPSGDPVTDESPSDIFENINQRITAEENLRRALAHVGPPADAPAEPSDKFPSDAQMRQVGDRLHVELLPSVNGPVQVHLTHVGRDPVWSTALVDHLAQQLVAEQLQNESYERTRRIDPDLEGWLDETRQKAGEAQAALDQFIKEHFDELTHPNSTDDRALEDVGAVDTAAAEPWLIDNPAWSKIRQQIDGLIAERDTLLIKFTAEHPRVRDLDWAIQQLQQRLDQTPRQVVDQRPLEERDPAVTPGPVPSDPEADYSATIAQYEQLKQKLDDAQSARLAAQETYDNQLRHVPPVTSGAIELISAARVTDRIGGAPPRALVLVLGLLALIVAGLMARWAGGGAKTTCFTSAAEVEQSLPIPVVGRISTTDGPPLPARKPDRSRLVRASTLACEVALGVLVIGFFFMALLDSSLMSQFVDDPFGAISETVSRAARRQF